MKRIKNCWLPLLLIAALLLSGCMAAPSSERNTVQITSPEESTLSFTLLEEEVDETAPEAPTEEIAEPSIEETAELPTTPEEEETAEAVLPEDGSYTTKDDVAAYLFTYGHLPENFISKKEAKAQGWDGAAKNLRVQFPGMSIGGDYFGNYEGQLPEKKGRRYTECDINFNGKSRGAERIVFSNDGLIYYTKDHYATFELLYGEE